ncbi:hypothetical protein FI667_g12811, partial [Globisporangium splendens]
MASVLALLSHYAVAFGSSQECEKDKMAPVHDEEHGWNLALSISAFRRDAVEKQDEPMITCWRISSTAATSWHRRSDIWIDATNYNGDDALCVTHVHDPPGRSPEDGVIFYLANVAKSASLLDANLAPMNHDRCAQVFASYSTYHYFRPITYRRWDPVKPLRLITKVQVVENNTHFPTSCPCGTIEGGNCNDGCDQDPFVALCVHCNEGVRVRVHDVVVDMTLVKATHTVHSAMDCDIMATRDLNGQKVSFHAHPRFTRIVQLWGCNGRYNTTRSFYRQQVAATRTQIGKDTRDAAVNKAVHTAGSLWPGLQLIQWSELHNIPGITVYTAKTLLRLKANRLSMWNYEKADLSCSNPECFQVVQSSVQHLFWECPKAKLAWNYFYALWAKIGITPGHDPAIWIFSLDLPDTPRHAWTTITRHIIGHKFSNEHLQDHLYPVAHMLWRYVSASLIQAIWCAHLRRMDSDPIESTAEMAIMMTRLEAGMRSLTRLAEAQAGDSDGHTVAAVLKAHVDCFLSQTDAILIHKDDVVADDESAERVANVHLTPFNSKTTNATCLDGMEAVSSAENPMQPFKFRAHMNSFFLLCLSRSRAVVDNRIIKKRFVSRIFVNADRERSLRVEYERNDAIEWIHRSELKSEVSVNADFGCE